MKEIAFIEVGMGTDLHGQDVTKAARKAVRNAIEHNSMPGILSFIPGGNLDEMKVRVTLAVPVDEKQVDVSVIRDALPYGQVEVVIVKGGLMASSGIVLPDKGDVNDQMIIVNAVIEVGY